jgi:undecaprenyl-diphosphatase
VIAALASFMGSEVVVVLGSLLVATFVIQRRFGAAGMLVLVTGGAQLLNNVLKDAFHRVRPETVIGWIAAQQYSFPSGHAMVSAAFYGYLNYLAWRLLHGWIRLLVSALVTLLILAIGASRIYLQAHYLSDVIAGYLCGFLWSDSLIVASRLLVGRRERRPKPHRAPRTVSA